MDTSLKKLNRVQLLQLLVEISEDRDALLSENIELEKEIARLAQKSEIPSTLKVGSIAEAALQANGFFESAQSAADDYLREIKRMRDQMATRSQAAVQQRVQAQTTPPTTLQAVSQAAASVDAGQSGQFDQSTKRIARALDVPQVDVSQPVSPEAQAQLDADRQLFERQQLQFQQQQLQYQQQLEQMKATADREARAMSDRVLARANAEAKAIVEEAQVRAEGIVADANRKSHVIVSRANQKANALLAEAKQKTAGPEAARIDPAAAGASSQSLASVIGQTASAKTQVEALQERQARQARREQQARQEQAASPTQQQTEAHRETAPRPSTTAEILLRGRHARVSANGA